MFIHPDRVQHMDKGWAVLYEDGRIITEIDPDGTPHDWNTVPKRSIKELTLKWYDRTWSIAGKSIYLQFKRAWITPGMAESILEERCIGYWEGDNKVVYRIEESTGKMRMTVETISK